LLFLIESTGGLEKKFAFLVKKPFFPASPGKTWALIQPQEKAWIRIRIKICMCYTVNKDHLKKN
jgi:hypothetical protein